MHENILWPSRMNNCLNIEHWLRNLSLMKISPNEIKIEFESQATLNTFLKIINSNENCGVDDITIQTYKKLKFKKDDRLQPALFFKKYYYPTTETITKSCCNKWKFSSKRSCIIVIKRYVDSSVT